MNFYFVTISFQMNLTAFHLVSILRTPPVLSPVSQMQSAKIIDKILDVYPNNAVYGVYTIQAIFTMGGLFVVSGLKVL